jgi:hypothetical protein
LKTNTGRTASPGWYNSAAFEKRRKKQVYMLKVSTEMPFLMK